MKVFGSAQGTDPRTQQWNLEDFREYFKKERGNLGNSKKFQEVIRAFDRFAGLQGQAINEETAVKMVKANENLKKACEAYAESRRGARTGSGKERLAVVDCLSMFREDMNLDQARDMRVVRELEGKTWEQAGKFQVAEVVLGDGGGQMVGDAMSQRLQVEHGGKKGFFTEQMEMVSLNAQLDKLVGSVDRTQNPALKEGLEAIRDHLGEKLKDFMNQAEIPDEGYEIAECISMMEESSRKEKMKNLMSADTTARKMAVETVRKYQSSLKASGPKVTYEEKEKLMDEAVEATAYEYRSYPQYGGQLRECKEALMEVPPMEEVRNRSARMYRLIKMELLLAKETIGAGSKEGKEQREALERASEDRDFMETWQKGIDIAHASEVGSGTGMIELDVGNELSSRNIASSRIAEFLGIGNMVAHSEKMIVRSGDKVTTGCFMEFAEGMDITAKGERSRRILDQVDASVRTPGYYKDMTSLEVFDFLCAQNDRHERNMFYKFEEKDGKKVITGLQGIDNDLAFGYKEELASRTQGFLEDMTFISSSLADRVNALNEDTLRYAIGDLIPENHIQAMVRRVEDFKDHMNKNMVRIDDGKWDLQEYKDKSPDQLDARGKAYLKGLQNLEKREKYVVRHKNEVIDRAFKGYHEKREAGPKVAISFDEIQKQERDAARKNPGAVLGKKSEAAAARAAQIRAQRRKELAEKGKEASEKQVQAPERKSQGMGIKK